SPDRSTARTTARGSPRVKPPPTTISAAWISSWKGSRRRSPTDTGKAGASRAGQLHQAVSIESQQCHPIERRDPGKVGFVVRAQFPRLLPGKWTEPSTLERLPVDFADDAAPLMGRQVVRQSFRRTHALGRGCAGFGRILDLRQRADRAPAEHCEDLLRV